MCMHVKTMDFSIFSTGEKVINSVHSAVLYDYAKFRTFVQWRFYGRYPQNFGSSLGWPSLFLC